jgi:methylated-DNA-[protein]-cysteine S-methyltransferase
MAGTAFQKQVWEGLLTIAYGTTISYAELARRIGRPGASRAVGAANGQNPIGLIVPCHRVIGANGTLTGYGGGLDRKEWLISHEAGVLEGHGRRNPSLGKLHPKEGARTLTGCV